MKLWRKWHAAGVLKAPAGKTIRGVVWRPSFSAGPNYAAGALMAVLIDSRGLVQVSANSTWHTPAEVELWTGDAGKTLWKRIKVPNVE